MSRALVACSLVLLTSAVLAQTGSKPSPNQTPNPAQAPNSSQTPNSAKPPVKKNPLLPYAGNWIGAFEDKPWILLRLNLSGEQFSGSLERAKTVDLNDNGEIKHVSEDFVTDPLVEAKLNPDGLLITVQHHDSQATDRYVMKLTSDTTAEIKMIAMSLPPGMAKPKPWKLMKVGK